MGLETGTYLSDLVTTNPTTTDKRREGDDHFRLIKTTLKNSFPNVDGAVNPSPAEFNYLVGVTSLLQAQLDARVTLALAPGAGIVETAGVLDVVAGLGIVINPDDVQIEISTLAAIEGNALDNVNDGYLIDDDGVPKRMSLTDDGLIIVEDLTIARTLATVDCNTYLEANNAAAIAITVDTGFGKKGNVIAIEQKGAGQVTLSGTAALNNANGLKTAKQFSVMYLVCKGGDIWNVIGDTTT